MNRSELLEIRRRVGRGDMSASWAADQIERLVARLLQFDRLGRDENMNDQMYIKSLESTIEAQNAIIKTCQYKFKVTAVLFFVALIMLFNTLLGIVK